MKEYEKLEKQIEKLESELKNKKQQLSEIETNRKHDYKYSGNYLYSISICKKCGKSEIYY